MTGLSEVISPQHYKHGSKETIIVIRDSMTTEQFIGYLTGNIIKYVSRAPHKGVPLSDCDKAGVYLQWLKDVLTGYKELTMPVGRPTYPSDEDSFE